MPNVTASGSVYANDTVPTGTRYVDSITQQSPPGSSPMLNLSSDGSFTFRADVPGEYVFQVVVEFPDMSRATEQLTISVIAPPPAL